MLFNRCNAFNDTDNGKISVDMTLPLPCSSPIIPPLSAGRIQIPTDRIPITMTQSAMIFLFQSLFQY